MLLGLPATLTVATLWAASTTFLARFLPSAEMPRLAARTGSAGLAAASAHCSSNVEAVAVLVAVAVAEAVGEVEAVGVEAAVAMVVAVVATVPRLSLEVLMSLAQLALLAARNLTEWGQLAELLQSSSVSS